MVVSHDAAELVQSGHGVLHADRPLGLERNGDHADGQSPDLLLGDPGHIVGRTGTGPAAHACGDEDDVRAVQEVPDLHVVLSGRLLSDLRHGASAQTVGGGLADQDLLRCLDGQQVLGIGVDGAELRPLDAGLDAAVDGVAAAAAAADDLDADVELLCELLELAIRI